MVQCGVSRDPTNQLPHATNGTVNFLPESDCSVRNHVAAHVSGRFAVHCGAVVYTLVSLGLPFIGIVVAGCTFGPQLVGACRLNTPPTFSNCQGSQLGQASNSALLNVVTRL